MSDAGQVFEGSCLCGRVRYRAVGPWEFMNHCHCTDCQKSHATAFATYAGIPRQRFTYLQGEDHLQSHRVESGTRRFFCRTCGANILSDGEDEPDTVYVAAGTLDTPLEVKFKAHHIFVRSKACWYEIQDGLPQYATYEESER